MPAEKYDLFELIGVCSGDVVCTITQVISIILVGMGIFDIRSIGKADCGENQENILRSGLRSKNQPLIKIEFMTFKGAARSSSSPWWILLKNLIRFALSSLLLNFFSILSRVFPLFINFLLAFYSRVPSRKNHSPNISFLQLSHSYFYLLSLKNPSIQTKKYYPSLSYLLLRKITFAQIFSSIIHFSSFIQLNKLFYFTILKKITFKRDNKKYCHHISNRTL